MKGDFLDAIKSRHKVFSWRDFKGSLAGVEPRFLQGKYIGLVEQVICAGGRVFVGTDHSTFSGYIPRLRGHIGAPDTHVYHTTDPNLTPKPKGEYPPLVGQQFYDEWHAVWEV